MDEKKKPANPGTTIGRQRQCNKASINESLKRSYFVENSSLKGNKSSGNKQKRNKEENKELIKR